MNILDEIKTAEQKAADIRRDAQQRARELLREEERVIDDENAAELLSAVKAADETLEKAEKAADEKAKSFVEENAKKDVVLEDKANENLNTAIEYIVKSVGDI